MKGTVKNIVVIEYPKQGFGISPVGAEALANYTDIREEGRR